MADPRERNCGECGYDLTGLPGRQGSCPECGKAWDAITGRGIDQFDESGRRRAERLLNRVRTLLFALFTLGVLICGGVGTLVASNPWRPIAIAGVIALVGLLATITSYFYEDDDA